jgi:RNA polymerase sigma-B factor
MSHVWRPVDEGTSVACGVLRPLTARSNSGTATSKEAMFAPTDRSDRPVRTLSLVRAPAPAARGGRDGDPEDDEVNALIRRVQASGDAEALDAVMTANDWLATSCARRMHRGGESLEDLEQVAREAILGAISRFDPERGIPFKAFAWATALGVLRHYYRDRWQVRVPRGIQELHLAAVRATEELTALTGRSPTIDDIAARLGADRDQIILALDAGHAYRAGSLDRPSTYSRPISDQGHLGLSALDESIEHYPDRARVREMLGSLPPRYRTILVMRFFEERTQLQIGQALGVSQVHVSRLMRDALKSLREREDAAASSA